MELSDLLLSLMSRAYGDILIQGYPNLDLIAPLDVQTLVQENPGKDIKQFLFLGKGTVDLQGKSLELANDRATYLHDPEDMISPSGRRESRLQAGVKYTSPQTFSSVKPADYLTIPVKSAEVGGGVAQSLKAMFHLLGKDHLYVFAPLGPDESEIRTLLNLQGHTIETEVNIAPRFNWVISNAHYADGSTAFDNRIIVKHPNQPIIIPPDTFGESITDALLLEGQRSAIHTLLLNGVKYKEDISNALEYQQTHNGEKVHLVAVITDSTAKLDCNLVEKQLLAHATYISNNDELGILCGESCSKMDDGNYVVKLGGTLHAIKSVRDLQRESNSYQNIFVTLGDYGSLSVDKNGHCWWVGVYPVAWAASPDTTGFGDTFAAGIALAENVDPDMPTSISQKFATALVASKLRSHTYVTEPIEQVTQLLRDNHAPTLYLGQFDQYNNLGNLRGNRVDRLTTWLSTESMIKRK